MFCSFLVINWLNRKYWGALLLCSGHETVQVLFIVPTGLHRGLCYQPSRLADRLACTSRAVCLCCVVFCLPPRLWVTIHTLPRVQLQGTVPVSASSCVCVHLCDLLLTIRFTVFKSATWGENVRSHIYVCIYIYIYIYIHTHKMDYELSVFTIKLAFKKFHLICFLFGCFDQSLFLIFHLQGCNCVFVPESVTSTCTLGNLKKKAALHSDKRTDCLFTKRSQEAIRQKIALENCSFWVTEQ